MQRLCNITAGTNDNKDKAKFLSKHAHYYGFREGPDGSRERYYIYNGKGFVVTEYGNEHEKVIANVRTCLPDEVILIMTCKNLQFGD